MSIGRKEIKRRLPQSTEKKRVGAEEDEEKEGEKESEIVCVCVC